METLAPDQPKTGVRFGLVLLGAYAFALTALWLGCAHAQAPGIYYVQVDHLNTPRAIYNQQQQLVWGSGMK